MAERKFNEQDARPLALSPEAEGRLAASAGTRQRA